MHIFHDWERWKEIGTSEVISNISNQIIAVNVLFERLCTRCGIKQFKKVKRETI